MTETHTIALAVITFLAAIVNGALGYGFSSITVPLALLFMANRVLNPALVLIEVVLNAYVLWVNREAFGTVASGFFPSSGEMPAEVAATLIHSADERIPVDDLALGVEFLRQAAASVGGNQAGPATSVRPASSPPRSY